MKRNIYIVRLLTINYLTIKYKRGLNYLWKIKIKNVVLKNLKMMKRNPNQKKGVVKLI